jgi:hypothetical protein
VAKRKAGDIEMVVIGFGEFKDYKLQEVPDDFFGQAGSTL